MCKYIKDWLGFELKPAVNTYANGEKEQNEYRSFGNNSEFTIRPYCRCVDDVNYLVQFLFKRLNIDFDAILLLT